VARRVDGVIFAALAEDSTSLGDLLDRGVPTMLASFGGTLDRRAGAIDIDEEEAMDAVIGYLAHLGHERFAFARQHAREAEVDRRVVEVARSLERSGLGGCRWPTVVPWAWPAVLETTSPFVGRHGVMAGNISSCCTE